MRSLIIFLCFLTSALAAPIIGLERRDAPAFNYTGDVPFTVDSQTLAGALTCPNGYPTADSPPVLLVHGTAADGNQTWNYTYVPALKADGYTACYVDLPHRAGIDMQVSAEYVAYNIHYLSWLSGGLPTSVITHSQGGPVSQWAMEWWPSTWEVTQYYLPICPDFIGVTMAEKEFATICPAYACEPSIWQQLTGSRFENALQTHNFRALVPTTAVWTEDDEIVTPPQTNAQLPGATVHGIQELCPGRIVDHIYVVDDAATYAILTDALKYGQGSADLNRVLLHNPNVCKQVVAPNMNPQAVDSLAYVIDGAVDGFLLDTARVPSEPSLMPYVYQQGGSS